MGKENFKKGRFSCLLTTGKPLKGTLRYSKLGRFGRVARFNGPLLAEAIVELLAANRAVPGRSVD